MSQPNLTYAGGQALPAPARPYPDVLTPEDEIISDPDAERATTRKIFRPDIYPENCKDGTARIAATLMHQRRGNNDARTEAPWLDVDGAALSELHKDEKAVLPLSGRETKRLFQSLTRLYKQLGDLDAIMTEMGIALVDGTDAIVLRGPGRELVERWLAEEGEEFFAVVEELRPELFETALLRRDHQRKLGALEEFGRELECDEWIEGDWEQYFRRNRWIFGYGLSYQFLTTVQDQPNYGGVEVTGRGTQRGDVLARTEADERFTILVELKKPSTRLLVPAPYRGQHIYRVDEHLAGGVAQLQANCASWFREGSMRPEWIKHEAQENLHTHEPKGILIAGHTREFGGDDGKVGSFERFRRGLKNPEVLTYDELFARASYLVEFNEQNGESDVAPGD